MVRLRQERKGFVPPVVPRVAIVTALLTFRSRGNIPDWNTVAHADVLQEMSSKSFVTIIVTWVMVRDRSGVQGLVGG